MDNWYNLKQCPVDQRSLSRIIRWRCASYQINCTGHAAQPLVKCGCIKGQRGPFHLRPNSASYSDAHAEKLVDHRANKDDTALKDDGKPRKFDSSDVRTPDRSIRITAKDLVYFGDSDRCPTCEDLQEV